MSERVPGLRGRLPQKHPADRFAIKWVHEYLPEGVLVAPVFPVDVSQGIVSWGVLGNGPDPTLTITTANGPGQPVGDCYFAAEAHHTMLSGAKPTSNAVAAEYDIYDHNQDDGVVIADALLWQHRRGEIGLFAPVHPDTIAAMMATFKRGVMYGVNLTDDADQLFTEGKPWTVSDGEKPDPDEGHVIYQVVADADGSATFVTWGADQKADAGWVKACPEEWWVLLTPADEKIMGAGYAALAADIAALPGEVGTVPPLPTPPGPTPLPPSPVTPTPAPAPVPVVPPVSLWSKIETVLAEAMAEIKKLLGA
jgi:hypothetical protein